jgi:hypothetical protein
MKYHILDKTAAHTGEYIDEEGRNVRLHENAATFETVEAARARAAQLDPAGTWAVVAYDMDPLPEGCALYAPPGLPEAWLVRCAGELWVVPARMNGWASRSPYRGHYPARAGWEEMDPRLAEGCGIPWAAPAEACKALGKE